MILHRFPVYNSIIHHLYIVSCFLHPRPSLSVTINPITNILNFLRNLHIVFHNSCSSLHSHQQCMRIPLSPRLHQHSLFVDLLMTAILTGVRQHPIVILICISLMISDVEHFFIRLLVICMSSLAKYLFRSFVHFLIGLFGFFGVELCKYFLNFGC